MTHADLIIDLAEEAKPLLLLRPSYAAWDHDFLAMCRFWAERKSKDPSTKVGAVITRGREIVSVGYNGLPMRVHDLPERYADRDLKLNMVVHAEANAIVFARRNLSGCTLYTWPFSPCSRCAGLIINANIAHVVAPAMPADRAPRWKENMDLAATMFAEAGVGLTLYED